MDIVDIDQDNVQGGTGTVGHREDEGVGADAGAGNNWMDQDQVECKVMRGQPSLYCDHSNKSQDEVLCSLLLFRAGEILISVLNQ